MNFLTCSMNYFSDYILTRTLGYEIDDDNFWLETLGKISEWVETYTWCNELDEFFLFTSRSLGEIKEKSSITCAISLIDQGPETAFYPPLPGKPHPHELLQPRSRVIQQAQKGHICWFYALQLLRNEDRVGKNPLSSQEKARKLEKIISEYRKKHTNDLFVTNVLPYISDIVASVNKAKSDLSSLHNVKEELDTRLRSLFIKERIRNAYSVMLDQFWMNTGAKDFSNYVREQSTDVITRTSLHDDWILSELGHFFPIEEIVKNVDEYMKEKIGRLSYLSTLYATEREEKHFEIAKKRNCVFLLCIKAYALEYSPWTPADPIENLIGELHSHGPLYVQGALGRNVYESSPFCLEKTMAGRNIWGWPPKAKKQETQILSDNAGSNVGIVTHTVLVVGAKISGGKTHVYYIDPIDGSNPVDFTTQKIYAISYKTFQQAACGLFDNIHFLDKTVGKGPYALYNPRWPFGAVRLT